MRDSRIDFVRRNSLENMEQGMVLMVDSETGELVSLQRQNVAQLKDRVRQERIDKKRKLML